MPQKNDTYKPATPIKGIFQYLAENAKDEVDAAVTYNLFSSRQGRGLQNFSPIVISIKFAQHMKKKEQLSALPGGNGARALTFLLTAACHPLYAVEAMRRQLHQEAVVKPLLGLAKEAGLFHLYKGCARTTILPTAVLLAVNEELDQTTPRFAC